MSSPCTCSSSRSPPDLPSLRCGWKWCSIKRIYTHTYIQKMTILPPGTRPSANIVYWSHVPKVWISRVCLQVRASNDHKWIDGMNCIRKWKLWEIVQNAHLNRLPFPFSVNWMAETVSSIGLNRIQLNSIPIKSSQPVVLVFNNALRIKRANNATV